MNLRRVWPLIPILVLAFTVSAEEAPATDYTRVLGENPSLRTLFEFGGVAMWPIFGVAIVGLVLVFERLFNLRRSRHLPKGFHKDVVKVVDMRGVDAALALCLERTTSLSRVLYAALLRHGSVRQELENAVIDENRRVLYDLRRNSRAIGVLSILAPMLGLFGTCIGVIYTLDDSAGLPDHYLVLANGFARALLPTAFGLLVALPLAAFFFYLRGKASDIARDVEETALEAVITLDRKARQSIRLIEDIEEQIETQDMPGIRAPDLDKEFEEGRDGSGLKTSITTHAGQAAASAAAAPSASSSASHPLPSAPPAAPVAPPAPPPQNAPKT
jgi:biopolymer transport protein ExbB